MEMETEMETDMSIFTSSSSYQSPIHYYHFIALLTNIIIYNNQQQQQKGKERGKEYYYVMYRSHRSINILYTIYYIYTYIHDQIQKMNRIEGIYRRDQPRRGWKVEERRERNDSYTKSNHLIQEHTKKEKREIYCLLSCHIRLGTVHMPYPWKGNSYSNSTVRERRERWSSSIIIHMVPIGTRIHYVVSSSRMIVTLWSMYQVIPTNTVPLYTTINTIT